MNYRDKYIGKFIVKPDALTIRISGKRIETEKTQLPTEHYSYKWVQANDDYIYLYYGCDFFEEDAPGSTCIVIAVTDVELDQNFRRKLDGQNE